MKRLCIGLAVALAGACALGETFTWTGAQDAYWTNAANWTVSGTPAGRCPGVVGDTASATDEMWEEWSVNTDRAFFTGAGANGSATVDLDGLFSISNLVVSGADAPVYTFGTGEQHLPLRSCGDLTVEANVVNMPILPGNVAYGVGEGHTSPMDFTIIRNDGAGELVLSNICFVVRCPAKYRPGAPEWSYHYLYLQGTGPIRFTGQRVFKSPVTGTSFTTLFDPWITCTGGLFFDNDFGSVRHTYFRADGVRMTLGDKGVYTMSSDGGAKFEIDREKIHVDVLGTGTLKLNTRGEVRVINTSSFTIDGPQVEPVYYNGNPCLRFTERGEFYVKGVSTRFSCPPYLTYYGTIKFDALGMKGTPGSLGDNDPVACLTRESCLSYVGAGETTDRAIALSNATDQAVGVLEQAGTGDWKLLAPVRVAAPSANLVLRGDAEAEGEIAGALADGVFNGANAPLGLAKKGSGTWRLSAANTYTGVTSLEGGTLVLGEEGSIANTSDIRFNGGALAVEGGDVPRSVELAKVTVVSGGSTLETRRSASVTVASVSVAGGTLNVLPTDGTTVAFADASLKGTSPAWLRYRGIPASIDAEGRVMPSVDHVIAAKGDVVPNAPAGSVAIVREGSGADTALGASETAVSSLVQAVEVPATIALTEDDVLTVRQLRIGEGGGNLTIGSVSGVGTVRGTDGLLLQNDSKGSKLDVSAAVSAGGELQVLANEGAAELSGGTDGEQFLRVRNGTLRITGEKTFHLDGAAIGTNTTQVHPPKIVFDGAKDVRLGHRPFKVGYFQGEGTMYAKETWISSSIRLPTVEMTVTNSTIVSAEPAATVWSNTDTNSLCVGHACSAVLNVEEGACITNRIMVGCCFNNTAEKIGVVRQHGGEVVSLTGDNAYQGSAVGHRGGYGYYELDGGRLVGRGSLGVGLYTVGVFYQNGGELSFTNRLDKPANGGTLQVGGANGGKGVWRMSGGKAILPWSLSLAQSGNDSAAYALVEGDADVDVFTGYVYLGGGGSQQYNHMKYGYLCLNGTSKFRVMGFYKPANGSDEGAPFRSVACVSFDGGMLRLTSGGSKDVFHPNDMARGVYGLNHVYVCDGGMTVDTTEASGRWTDIPLEGLGGKGVTGVRGFQPITGLMGPPRLVVTGDGSNAVAFADFDSKTGTMTGITIGCPGEGYETATITTEGLVLDGRQKTWTCTLAPNRNAGSFTKAGAGTFAFRAANTYGGKTVLKGGTLILDVPNALPANSPIVPQGGLLAATAENFPSELTVDVSELDPDAKAVTFAQVISGELAADPAVTIVGGEKGQDWRVSSAGGVFRVGCRKGMMLIVK